MTNLYFQWLTLLSPSNLVLFFHLQKLFELLSSAYRTVRPGPYLVRNLNGKNNEYSNQNQIQNCLCHHMIHKKVLLRDHKTRTARGVVCRGGGGGLHRPVWGDPLSYGAPPAAGLNKIPPAPHMATGLTGVPPATVLTGV